jgi:hypothetical protein
MRTYIYIYTLNKMLHDCQLRHAPAHKHGFRRHVDRWVNARVSENVLSPSSGLKTAAALFTEKKFITNVTAAKTSNLMYKTRVTLLNFLCGSHFRNNQERGIHVNRAHSANTPEF